jgi:hypothetical protein
VKIVLSRKGFDSSIGGCPSPIFEDGSLCSLPIPSRSSTLKFDEIAWKRESLGRVVSDLTKSRVKGSDVAHLDPDLNALSLHRRPGWRPLFGQTDTAQRHLENQGVEAGDLFLFFGWFREAEIVSGRYRFRRGAPDLHVLFGWLRVSEVWRLYESPRQTPDWALEHPHVVANLGSRNTVYVSRDAQSGGVFPSFRPDLALTAPGVRLRTSWRLPEWFHPRGRGSMLTYHRKDQFSSDDSDFVLVDSAKRGQEFVLDTADYPEAEAWVESLVRHSVTAN